MQSLLGLLNLAAVLTVPVVLMIAVAVAVVAQQIPRTAPAREPEIRQIDALLVPGSDLQEIPL